MDTEKPLFECAGGIRIGDSFLDRLGIEGRLMTIRVFNDRLELCDVFRKHEFLREDITTIKVVTFLKQKIGIMIQHTTPNEPSYVRFDSLLEKRIKRLLSVLKSEGYPLEG